MSKLIMPVGLCVYPLAYLVMVPISLGQQPENPLPEEMQDRYPLVPAEVWQEAMSALKRSATYEMAQALRREAIEPKVEQWKKDLGSIPATVEYRPWLKVLTEAGRSGFGEFTIGNESYAEKPGARQIRQSFLSLDHTPGQDMSGMFGGSPGPYMPMSRRAPTPILGRPGRPQQANLSYYIPPRLQEELKFSVLASFRIEHPLHAKVENLTAEQDSLVELVEKLLHRCPVKYDYVINYSAAANTLIRARLSNQNIADCLRVVCVASNCELSATENGNDGGRVSDPVLSYWDLVRSYYVEVGSAEDKDTSPPKPAEWVERQGRELVERVESGKGLRISIRPRPPETNVHVEK